MTTYQPNEHPPFYGPKEGVDPADEDTLIPEDLEKEINSWGPISKEDFNNRTFSKASKDHFLQACRNIFKKGRFFVNHGQVHEVADLLVQRWGDDELFFTTKKSGFSLTLQCGYIKLEMRLSPVEGRGRGPAGGITRDLDLEMKGLRLLKVTRSPKAIEKKYFVGKAEASSPKATEEQGNGSNKRNPLPRVSLSPSSRSKAAGSSEKRKQSTAAVTGDDQLHISSDDIIKVLCSDQVKLKVSKRILAKVSSLLRLPAKTSRSTIEILVPSPVMKEAITFSIGKSLNEKVILQHLDSCFALSYSYEMVEFEKDVVDIVSQRLSVNTIQQTLICAHMYDPGVLMERCLSFVQKNAAPLLTNPFFLKLATQDPGLWKRVVNAIVGNGPNLKRQSSGDSEAATSHKAKRRRVSGESSSEREEAIIGKTIEY